jgi:radical SAM superfamily enzyme YgiQ (UPF0313 family)
MDDIPFPDYSKLEGYPAGYHLPLFAYRKRHGATMITSRGCPFTCSYCDRTVYERKYRYNSAEYVWEHMKMLRDRYGVHHINFYDDLFTASRKRVLELMEVLIKKPLGMDWNCAIRIGHNDDVELFRLMKQAGCLQVSMGIESADPEAREVLERAAVADLDVDAETEARNLIAAAVRRQLARRTGNGDPDLIRDDAEARLHLEELGTPIASAAAAEWLLGWLHRRMEERASGGT